MNEQWQVIEEIVASALELPEDRQREYLAERCGEDSQLLEEVESLIAVSGEQLEVFEAPLFSLDLEGEPYGIEQLTAGEQLGQFTIIEKIGRGGMSTVFRAHDEAHGRSVALKVLDRKDLGEVAREATILARLSHAGIAQLYSSARLPTGEPYLVMELIEGVAIDRYCIDNDLSTTEKLELFRKVLAAAAFAHRHQIIHRDLKPTNILVNHDGEPKLLDFGISKVGLPDGVAPVTARDQRPMTLAFASPEQISGAPISTTSDVYSLGVLLHLLLTGHLPYRVEEAELGWAITTQEPDLPSATIGRVPGLSGPQMTDMKSRARQRKLSKELRGDLDSILLKALRKEPECRYLSVDEFSDDIRRFLGNEAVTARSGARGYRTRKFLRRHHRAAAVVAALLCLLLTSLGVLILQRSDLLHERNRASLQAQRAASVAGFLTNLFESADPERSDPSTTLEAVLEDATRELLRSPASDGREHTDLMVALAQVLVHLEQLEPARELAERAMELTPGRDVDDHYLRAKALTVLGSAEFLANDLARAEELHRESLGLRTAAFGADSPEASDALLPLSIVLAHSGRFDEAESAAMHAIRSFDSREQSPVAALRGRSIRLNGFATILYRRGHYRDAERILQATLRAWHSAGIERNLSIAHLQGNLAVVKEALGDASGAMDLRLSALELKQEFLGPDHRKTQTELNNLAVALYGSGRYGEAAELMAQVVSARSDTLGPEHLDTLLTKQNLAGILSAQGKNEDAEVLYREVLESRSRQLGAAHPDVLLSQQNLATALKRQGAVDDAIELYEQALAGRERILGDGHPDTSFTRINLADSLAMKDGSMRALELSRKAAVDLGAILPADHWRLDMARSVEGASLAAMGQEREGLEVLRSSHARLLEKLGEGSIHVREAHERLARATRREPR